MVAPGLLVLFPAVDGLGHVGGDGPGHGGEGLVFLLVKGAVTSVLSMAEEGLVQLCLLSSAYRDGLVLDCFLITLVVIVLDMEERQAVETKLLHFSASQRFT
jgi:hypothetical protein